MREKNLEECLISSVIGELVTMIIFAFCHKMFTGCEVIVFWMATHMICTYGTWTAIELKERKKSGLCAGTRTGR